MSIVNLDGFTLNGTDYNILDRLAQNRIDNLVANANNTEGNSELVDIRVGWDGTVYTSAGTAVREQVVQLMNKISKSQSDLNNLEKYFLGKNDFTMIRGSVSLSTGSTSETGTSTTHMRTKSFVNLHEGDFITFNEEHTVILCSYNENGEYLGYENIPNNTRLDADFYGYIRVSIPESFTDDDITMDKVEFFVYSVFEYLENQNNRITKSEQEIMSHEELLEETLSYLFNVKNEVYPIFIGRLNNNGVRVASQTHGYTSSFFFAKKGSILFVTSNEVWMRVAKYTSNDANTFESIKVHVSNYIVESDGWYKLDIEYVNTTLVADSTIFDYLSGYVITKNDYNLAIVSDYHSLSKAVYNPYIKEVVLCSDIIVETGLSFRGSKTVIGNGHTITGSENNRYLIAINEGCVTLQDLILRGANDDVVYVGGNSVVKLIHCDISNSFSNDGVGTHGSSSCYIFNCKLHDNYDEGVSTHDASYCEVINTEAYNNGYIVGTTEISGASFGGIHIGGSQMGKVIDCYAHHNARNGINFIPVNGVDASASKSLCSHNTSVNNNYAGLRFATAYNIECFGNISCNNQVGISFGIENEESNYGCDGIIAGNTLFNNTSSPVTIDSGADKGLIFDISI